MMRKILSIISFLLLCNIVFAQNLGSSNGDIASANFKSHRESAVKTSEEPADAAAKARRQIISVLDMFRSYSVPVNSSAQNEGKMGNNDFNSSSDFSNDGKEFEAYLAKIEKIIIRKLDKLEEQEKSNLSPNADRSSLLMGLSLVKSANCLVTKKEGLYVRTKDLDGNEILAFPLDSLKSNSRYGQIENYKEGFAKVAKDQVFGFLNLCGEEVIPYQYEKADHFNNGKALVKKVDWYFVDATGTEGAAFENVVDAKALTNGYSWVKFANGKQAIVDNRFDETKTTISGLYDAIDLFYKKEVFRVRNGLKYGLIDLSGKVKLEILYDKIEPTNLASLYTIESNKKIGIVDTSWAVVFKPVFDGIGSFNEFGLAQARQDQGVRLISSRSLKNTKLYSSIGGFSNQGLAIIKDDAGKYGIIDTNLRLVIEPSYVAIGDFTEFGLAPACKFEGHCGYINAEGKEVVPNKYADVTPFNKFGLAVASELPLDSKDKIYSVMDKTGRVVIHADPTTKISYRLTDSIHADKFIVVDVLEKGNFVGFHLLDSATLKQVTPSYYEVISVFDANNLFRVRKNNLWGLMDLEGKITTKCIYKDIKKQREGYYPVQNEAGKMGFIDKKGKIMIPFEYDDVKPFRGGNAIVTKGKERWGLINKFNAKIVPCMFKSVNVSDTKYELFDGDGNSYIINDNGDCEQNCKKFEDMRKIANQAAAATGK
jgi:WG containing repeat